MTRSLTVIVSVPVRVAGGEERIPVRVEERPAVGGQRDVLERGALVQRLGRRQQSVPGEVGGVERFDALFVDALVEVVEHVADAVASGEQGALRQQAAFLGEEQEDQPHQHRDGCLVDLIAVGRAAGRGGHDAWRRARPRTGPGRAARPPA